MFIEAYTQERTMQSSVPSLPPIPRLFDSSYGYTNSPQSGPPPWHPSRRPLFDGGAGPSTYYPPLDYNNSPMHQYESPRSFNKYGPPRSYPSYDNRYDIPYQQSMRPGRRISEYNAPYYGGNSGGDEWSGAGRNGSPMYNQLDVLPPIQKQRTQTWNQQVKKISVSYSKWFY